MSIMLVGEAWGKDEEEQHAPFVGASGRLLNGLLSQAGIRRADCYVTNVFNLRPKPTNDIKNLCGPRAQGIPNWPALSSGKYIRAEYAPEVKRLFDEIEREAPTLIVALGATPLWALSGITPKITQVRGSPFISPTANRKVLPTFHPAAAMRDYKIRPVIYADLCKAKAEAEFPEVRAPRREVWVHPSLQDITEFYNEFMASAPIISADIETRMDQITCIGFAPDPEHAIVVPFWDMEREDGNYWRSLDEELAVWTWVQKVCAKHKLLFQNGLFDMQWLWKVYGIPCPHADEDTMLLHHAMQPEMKKSLGFLASIYTQEPSWKFMRKSTKKEDAA